MKRRKINPPHYLVAGLLAELALDRWAPLARVLPRPFNYLGALVIAGGLTITIWAALLFKRAKTGLVPFSESTALVVGGPYRLTRNPMYLGMLFVSIGTAMILGSATPLLVPPLFVAVITARFILPEEAHLERAFGESYLAQKKTSRRWL